MNLRVMNLRVMNLRVMNLRVALAMRLVTVIIVCFAWVFVPNFGTTENLRALLFSVSSIGIAAVGLSFVTLSGRLFSLSIGATVAISTIVFASTLHFGLVGALICTLSAGLAIGLVQGVVIGYLRTDPIVTTIASAAILVGIGQLFTGGLNVTGKGDASALQASLAGVPVQVLLFFILSGVAWFWYTYTRFGRGLALVGVNERAAVAVGMPTSRPVILAFGLSALAAAMAGALVASDAGQGNLQLGTSFGFDAIVAVVVGGVSVKGGIGSPLDAAVGALFVGLLGNVLVLAGLNYETQLALKGLFVLLAVVLAGRAAQRPGRR
jgi:ribose transport system permease protein